MWKSPKFLRTFWLHVKIIIFYIHLDRSSTSSKFFHLTLNYNSWKSISPYSSEQHGSWNLRKWRRLHPSRGILHKKQQYWSTDGQDGQQQNFLRGWMDLSFNWLTHSSSFCPQRTQQRPSDDVHGNSTPALQLVLPVEGQARSPYGPFTFISWKPKEACQSQKYTSMYMPLCVRVIFTHTCKTKLQGFQRERSQTYSTILLKNFIHHLNPYAWHIALYILEA